MSTPAIPMVEIRRGPMAEVGEAIARVLAEYLGEVKGYRLDDIVRQDVTESDVREEMMAWFAEDAP